MAKPVRVEPEAEDEIAEAMAWYDEARMGLGGEYLTEIQAAMRALALVGPECRPVHGVPAELGARRKLVRRFPYMVVFIELPTVVRVLAVAHVRRRPGFWKGRL